MQCLELMQYFASYEWLPNLPDQLRKKTEKESPHPRHNDEIVNNDLNANSSTNEVVLNNDESGKILIRILDQPFILILLREDQTLNLKLSMKVVQILIIRLNKRIVHLALKERYLLPLAPSIRPINPVIVGIMAQQRPAVIRPINLMNGYLIVPVIKFWNNLERRARA